MASFNKWIGMGNLTRDPELRVTPSGMAIVKVSLACSRKYKDKQSGEWVEKPCFVDITIFGKTGEAFAKYHKKGSMAFFEGRLELDTWDDKNTGQKRSKLFVVADSWEFVSSGKDDRKSPAAQAQSGSDLLSKGATDYGDESSPF